MKVSEKEHRGNEAALYLEATINGFAHEGWEFYRVDSMTIGVDESMFGGLITQSGTKMTTYNPLTFRRPRS
jgi:hypothetical protein